MSQLERRVKQLESQRLEPGGFCPHVPPITRTFEEVDGQRVEITGQRYGSFQPAAPPAPCPCGRPPEELHVVFVEMETMHAL